MDAKDKLKQELRQKVLDLRSKSKSELLQRLGEMTMMEGFTREDGIEYDALKITIKGKEYEEANQ